jgi:hypothetical protein
MPLCEMPPEFASLQMTELGIEAFPLFSYFIQRYNINPIKAMFFKIKSME